VKTDAPSRVRGGKCPASELGRCSVALSQAFLVVGHLTVSQKAGRGGWLSCLPLPSPRFGERYPCPFWGGGGGWASETTALTSWNACFRGRYPRFLLSGRSSENAAWPVPLPLWSPGYLLPSSQPLSRQTLLRSFRRRKGARAIQRQSVYQQDRV